jgi:hypothetical protein
MKNYLSLFLPGPIRLAFFFSLLAILVLHNSPVIGANSRDASRDLVTGYTVLKLFLEDEQYLSSIRRVKTVITFEGISESSTLLIDDIADTSEQALEELEKLATATPAIVFEDFSEESIGKSTLDSLRMTTAREFLLDSDEFEKNLLLSQSQILRVISHLAEELAEKETNGKRKAWLDKLAERYESYYQQVYLRLAVTASDRA